MSTTTVAPVFEIVPYTNLDTNGYIILRDGVYLRSGDGAIRVFRTRNSARKRIARERSGNFHN